MLACRQVNSRKADRLPEEVGLRLLKKPDAPRELPVTMLLRNQHGIADWEMFLGASGSGGLIRCHGDPISTKVSLFASMVARSSHEVVG